MTKSRPLSSTHWLTMDIFLTVLIFIYCINFFNVGVYVPLVTLPLVLIYLLKGKFSKTFYLTAFILFGFFMTYSIFLYIYQYSSNISILGKLLYPTMFFIIGNFLVEEDLDYKKTYRSLYTIIIAFTIYGVLSTLKATLIYGNGSVTARETIGRIGVDIWTNNFISATALNSSLAFGLSLLAILFIKDKYLLNSNKIKLISFVCFFASTYALIQLGNRTGIIIIILSFFITLLFSDKLNKRKLVSILLVMLTFIILSFLYNINTFGIKSIVENSYIFNRFKETNLEEDPRVAAWKATFIGLFENPMGGKETYTPLFSAHNLWLDVGYEAGLIPFTLLVAFTLISLISVITVIRLDFPPLLKGLIVALYSSFIATFFVEPVLIGLNEYFTIFCLILGIVQRLIFDKKNKKRIRYIK
ncbi:O-antigen ligase family protein [Niallia sp. Krafla_26]|uniref:O-antigen ligase family protein n=1 Tax=Niallia sp. Krafla_26 TaxID=3064703 RepID=UPI003D171646